MKNIFPPDILNRFSESVDAFAVAAREVLDAQYRKMMSFMEKAYDRYL